MARTASTSCDCGWLRAACDKMQSDKTELEREIKHLKNLLWKSSGSWAEKEGAVVEEDIVMASEEVVNEPIDTNMD